MARTSTVQPVTQKIIALVQKVGDPVIVRISGKEYGMMPNELYRTRNAQKVYIRKSTVQTLMSI